MRRFVILTQENDEPIMINVDHIQALSTFVLEQDRTLIEYASGGTCVVQESFGACCDAIAAVEEEE
jgi:hypothetical protein